MKKIIVTGALGHIGSKLIRVLPKELKDTQIIMVDNLSTMRYCSLYDLPKNASYEFLEKDVREINWDDLLTENVLAVIHLAAITDAAGTADKPEVVHQNNFESTKIIADACLNRNIPLIFPSSTSVYGSQSELVDEQCTELSPQSPYAECKIKEESYIRELFTKGLKGTICRLGTIYGTSPGMRFHTAVNKFCWQANFNQPITVWETAMDQKRPYLCLDDCCATIAHILKNSLYTSEVYNIVSNNFTVRDVISVIKKYVPDLSINMVQHKIMNQLSYEVSADKFSRTGFTFQGLIDDAISNTISILKTSNGK